MRDRQTVKNVDLGAFVLVGGLFVGKLQGPHQSRIPSESALQYYVQQYSKTGRRGPLNWYRSMEKTGAGSVLPQGKV
ncbi:Bifunctional epoxide hydrolase 2 [Acipenser ruthenus]|uniref:Bifunctional epoxide hydrolase 2 n=1 Tax=Acipenser ruthenus TaxID=7906 RepID=A0A444U550_ACIRT|nr:Bifunctional epoxide hydrolase 2 [Acipenser ruthenus]